MKYDINTNSIMLNSMVKFSFRPEIHKFDHKFGPKKHSCLFKIKLGIKPNSDMLNLMVVLICSILEAVLFSKVPYFQNCLFNTLFGQI